METRLWRYVDRELGAAEVAEVSDHLARCATCRALYYDYARDANLLRVALSEVATDEGLAESVVREMEAASLIERPPTWQRFWTWTARHPSWRRYASAAAVFLCAAGALFYGLWSTQGSRHYLGQFRAAGEVVMYASESSGREGVLVDRGDCWPGAEFDVADGATLNLDLHSPLGPRSDRIEVEGPAVLRLSLESSRHAFSCELVEGMLTASVRPGRAAEAPFIVSTPEAIVRVVGTRFVVDAQVEGVTALKVQQGRVTLQARAGGHEVFVGPESGSWSVSAADVRPRRSEGAGGESGAAQEDVPNAAEAVAPTATEAPPPHHELRGGDGRVPDSSARDLPAEDLPAAGPPPRTRPRGDPRLDHPVGR